MLSENEDSLNGKRTSKRLDTINTLWLKLSCFHIHTAQRQLLPLRKKNTAKSIIKTVDIFYKKAQRVAHR